MKRLTILLAVILALSIFASAAGDHHRRSAVTLTVIESQRQISVTVPAALPVSVVDGKVLTAATLPSATTAKTRWPSPPSR